MVDPCVDPFQPQPLIECDFALCLHRRQRVRGGAALEGRRGAHEPAGLATRPWRRWWLIHALTPFSLNP